MDLIADLKGFLKLQTQIPHQYGFSDCALVLADWWKFRMGFDPAAHLRGTYCTEDECWAVLDESGGMLRLVTDLATRAGARPVLDPAPGDIAVIGVAGLRFGAIRTPSDRWFVKSANGSVGISEARVLKVWSF